MLCPGWSLNAHIFVIYMSGKLSDRSFRMPLREDLGMKKVH